MEVNLGREEEKAHQQKDGAEVNTETACDSPASEPSPGSVLQSAEHLSEL
jgi:hypothetical protein